MYNAFKMSWHTWSFDETKCMSILIEYDELLEKSGIKSAMVLKKNSIMNQYTIKNT